MFARLPEEEISGRNGSIAAPRWTERRSSAVPGIPNRAVWRFYAFKSAFSILCRGAEFGSAVWQGTILKQTRGIVLSRLARGNSQKSKEPPKKTV